MYEEVNRYGAWSCSTVIYIMRKQERVKPAISEPFTRDVKGAIHYLEPKRSGLRWELKEQIESESVPACPHYLQAFPYPLQPQPGMAKIYRTKTKGPTKFFCLTKEKMILMATAL